METEISALDTVFVLLCGVLVFFMNTGFALLESGFCRAKNTVNILSKNVLVFAIASIAFFLVGFGFMFGDGNSIIGLSGFAPAFDGTDVVSSAPGTLPLTVFFFFQMCFAATAATIVSGAVAERIKLGSFLIFSTLLVAIVYPIVGHWLWGGGFLAEAGFHDFAGSTIVHSVGGWAALTGAFLLGPRLGKYGKDGKPRAIPGHNMALATAGALILWMGWFGFNPGSQLAADAGPIASIALVTSLSAAAGALVACAVAYWKSKAPDLSMILNGALAGLVAITAGCDVISPLGALIVGGLAGGVVVFAVLMFDRIRIDDPVGAISVHLVCGAFGTLMVGLFAVEGGLLYGGGADLLVAQLIGVGAVGAFTVPVTAGIWLAIKATVGIRAPEQDERIGLDISEMQMEAYPSDSVAGSGPSPGIMPAMALPESMPASAVTES